MSNIRSTVVVVVDDDADAADSLAAALETFGYTVFTAYGAREAITLILEKRPEAVVSDLDMPGMSGLEEAIEVRAIRGLRQPCMVAVTGAASFDTQALAMHAGFDAFLPKPPSLRALLAVLQRID